MLASPSAIIHGFEVALASFASMPNARPQSAFFWRHFARSVDHRAAFNRLPALSSPRSSTLCDGLCALFFPRLVRSQLLPRLVRNKPTLMGGTDFSSMVRRFWLSTVTEVDRVDMGFPASAHFPSCFHSVGALFFGLLRKIADALSAACFVNERPKWVASNCCDKSTLYAERILFTQALCNFKPGNVQSFTDDLGDGSSYVSTSHSPWLEVVTPSVAASFANIERRAIGTKKDIDVVVATAYIGGSHSEANSREVRGDGTLQGPSSRTLTDRTKSGNGEIH